MKNKKYEPEVVDWQKLLICYESIIADYPDIQEREKIEIEIVKIKEKIKNMQGNNQP